MIPFCQRSIDFLYFNHKHNSKAWYAEHREDFKKYLSVPFCDLATALEPTMRQIDPKIICNPKANGTVSKLNKDLRFAKDKTCLYRDTMWMTLMREKSFDLCQPAYFFEISPYRVRYGCGFYWEDGATVKTVRKLILENAPIFQKAKECYDSQNEFTLFGEEYKKDMFADAPEGAREWLNKKYLCVIAQSQDIDFLCSPDLADNLARKFLQIKPIYDFLSTAQEIAHNV